MFKVALNYVSIDFIYSAELFATHVVPFPILVRAAVGQRRQGVV